MPQIAKGKDKRSAVITTRFTEAEKKQLAEMFGKPARGVHAIVVAALREQRSK